MYSAFGVDHGDVVAKARRRRNKPAPVPVRRPAPQVQPGAVATAAGKTSNVMHRVGEANVSVKGVGESLGGGAERAAGFFRRRPGLTGTIALGGAGVLGYRHLRNKEPKRKKVVT